MCFVVCVLFAVCCLLFVVCSLWCAVCCLLFVVCCLLVGVFGFVVLCFCPLSWLYGCFVVFDFLFHDLFLFFVWYVACVA